MMKYLIATEVEILQPWTSTVLTPIRFTFKDVDSDFSFTFSQRHGLLFVHSDTSGEEEVKGYLRGSTAYDIYLLEASHDEKDFRCTHYSSIADVMGSILLSHVHCMTAIGPCEFQFKLDPYKARMRRRKVAVMERDIFEPKIK